MRKISLALVAVLPFSQSVVANSIEDTHRFRLGAYEQDIDVTGGVTAPGFPEVEVDFDKVLGLEDSSTTLLLDYQWRFKEKWALQAFYSQMEAEGKKLATKDFNYDGIDYTAGIRLDTEFNLDTYLVAVNYSWLRDDKKEVGLGLGLHAFDIDTTIAAGIGIDGEVLEGTRSNTQLTAPLPNIRAYGTYMITPKWEVSATGGWLSFSYDDYDGGYLFLTAFTEYRFTEHFGVGLSYQAAEIDVTHEDNKGKQQFDIELYGPSIYLTYGF
jgi:hypothetical protein